MRIGIKLTSGNKSWSALLTKTQVNQYNKHYLDLRYFARPLTFDLYDIDSYKDHFSYDFIDDLVKKNNPPKFLLTEEQVLVETILLNP